ncbi:MAG: flagellar biosynthetic protein FliO [Phycisphaeraceae bacterium]|nr:flagellar biosynthetic protein FliO [Phycisphaeraceae bacterium]
MPRGSTALFVVAMLLVARAAAADDTAFRPPMLLPGDSLVANTPVAIERAAPHVPPPCEALPIVPQRHSGAPKASTAVQDGAGPDGTSAAAGEGGTSNAPGAEVSAVSATEGPFWWRLFESTPLLVLLGVLGALIMLLRVWTNSSRAGGPRPAGVVEVVARFPLSRGQQVILMRVGRRVIVAHQADRTLRTLSEVTDADEVAEILSRAREQGGDLFSRILDRKSRSLDPFADAEMVDLTRHEPIAARAGRSSSTPRARSASTSLGPVRGTPVR